MTPGSGAAAQREASEAPEHDAFKPQVLDTTEYEAWWREAFRRKRGRVPTEATVRTTMSRLKGAARRLGVHDPAMLATTLETREGVNRLLDALHASLTPSGVGQTVDVLHNYGRWAVAKGFIHASVLDKDDRPPSNPVRQKELYDPADLVTIIRAAYARDLRFGLFLDMLDQTGRRVGEVVALEWSWLRLEDDPAHFIVPPQAVKTGREAYVPVMDDLALKLTENQAELQASQRGMRTEYRRDARVFVFPFSYETAFAKMERLCGSLGIKPLGFHALRHARATTLLKRGVPVQAVSALLGHSVPVLMRTYSHATGLNYADYMRDSR